MFYLPQFFVWILYDYKSIKDLHTIYMNLYTKLNHL